MVIVPEGHPMLRRLASACTRADAISKEHTVHVRAEAEAVAEAVMLAREVVRRADLEDQAVVAREGRCGGRC